MSNLPEPTTTNQPLPALGLEMPHQRLLLELEGLEQADPKLKLRQQNQAGGMGWFTQKTINLNLAEAENLIRELQRAVVNAKLVRSQGQRARTASQAAGEASSPEEEKVIEFPLGRAARRAAPAETFPPGGENNLLQFRPRKR